MFQEWNYIVLGEYTGSSRCTISAANELPCRMASATEIIISAYGMTCSSAGNILSFSLQRSEIFLGALFIFVQCIIFTRIHGDC